MVKDIFGNTVQEGDQLVVPFGAELIPAKAIKVNDGSLLQGVSISGENIQAQQTQPMVVLQIILVRPVMQGVVLGAVKASVPESQSPLLA